MGGVTMDAVGKIGLVIPEILDLLEHELVQGIHRQAKLLGYDVLVFTDTFNVTYNPNRDAYIEGLENIYQLLPMAGLDGILFVPERFHGRALCESIYQILKQLSVPCLLLERESADFPYLFPEQRKSIKLLTDHLIRAHHCRRLYCMTGMPRHFASEERLAGFCEAMEENGLPVEEGMIFYGDFWIEKPRQLALDIASGSISRPDAVVCTSDAMASGLCDALEECGISVPEDIAVTGYDGSWYAVLHSPRITTISGREAELGAQAVCRLYTLMTGRSCAVPPSRQRIQYGQSCGCFESKTTFRKTGQVSSEQYIRNIMHHYIDQKRCMASDIISRMSAVDSLEELAAEIHALTYSLHHVESLDICLCEDWRFDFENPEHCRHEGFSEQMRLLYSGRQDEKRPADDLFTTKQILPALEKPHEPQLIVLTSLHDKKQIFGYAASTYRDAQDIYLDEHFLNWCDAVANGLVTLQNKMYRTYVKQQFAALSVHDPSTGLYNKRGFMEQIPKYRGHSDCVCLLISYSEKTGASARAYLTRHTLIANALRLSSGGEELLCRLGDTVFAVVFRIGNRDVESAAETRIMLLEEKMREFQGGVLHPQIPDLITDCSALTFQKMSEAGAFIEERLQTMLNRAEAAANAVGDYREKIYRLRREIFSSPQNDWSLPAIASSLGISNSHFQRIYKTEFGISCMEDVIAARLEKAKWLLLHSELSVQEIADQCGYHHTNHFMRQFKHRVGITAMQYRRDQKK